MDKMINSKPKLGCNFCMNIGVDLFYDLKIKLAIHRKLLYIWDHHNSKLIRCELKGCPVCGREFKYALE